MSRAYALLCPALISWSTGSATLTYINFASRAVVRYAILGSREGSTRRDRAAQVPPSAQCSSQQPALHCQCVSRASQRSSSTCQPLPCVQLPVVTAWLATVQWTFARGRATEHPDGLLPSSSLQPASGAPPYCLSPCCASPVAVKA